LENDGGLLVEDVLMEKTCCLVFGTGEKLKLLDFNGVTLLKNVD
jgi:hypothetical protein